MSSQANPCRLSTFALAISALAGFGIICAFIASLSVLANDVYYFAQYGLTPSVGLLLVGLVAGLLPRPWGLGVVIALLPLTVGIPSVLDAVFGAKALAMPNPGLDLVAGLFLCSAAQVLANNIRKTKDKLPAKYSWSSLPPWPIGLVMAMITVSAILAIARNIYMSATSTSIKGVLFNLMHFRPLDWHADYLPIGNWVAYAIATGLIILVMSNLKAIEVDKKNSWIFRPLMIGLAISAIAGLTQAATGWGLPPAQLEFRKDAFGFAAVGLQPDLHAFAAHMLLGVVGLWGYFLSCKSRLERYCMAAIFLLCSAGLVASKSRASLLIAIIALLIFGLLYFYRHSKKYFAIALIVFVVTIFFVLMGSGSIPGLAWVGELLAQMQNRRLDSLSDLGGLMGSRFEIWSAAINMFSSYPLMGVGEGDFYRLSSNLSFARSEFLQLNRGENAHNYFLQVLAENGLVGIAIFAIAFIVPYRACQDKKILLPVSIALISLFLGNVFAHSFLVRESLLIGASVLGLIYSFAITNKANVFSAIDSSSGKVPLYGLMSVIVLMFGVAIEVVTSYGKLPFQSGVDCFVRDVRAYPDGWTSGAWEELLPRGSKGLELSVAPNLPNINKKPINATLELLIWIPGSGKVSVDAHKYSWGDSKVHHLIVSVPTEYIDSAYVKSARLQLNSCYTPRNMGMSTDGRRLGVQIENVEWK